MKQKLSILRYLALAAIVATALAFGAKQAPADAECRDCTQPPPTACQHKPDPNGFCYDLCKFEYDCIDGGDCHPADFCICREKK
jgi:hypothetical protein